MKRLEAIINFFFTIVLFCFILLGNSLILRLSFVNAHVVSDKYHNGSLYLLISLLLIIFTTTSVLLRDEKLSMSNLFFHICSLTALFINYRITRYGAGEVFDLLFGFKLNFYHAPEISSALYAFILFSLIILFSNMIRKIFT